MTENRLIYANEALRMIQNSQTDNTFSNTLGESVWDLAHDSCISCVEACSTVDAQEVVHAHWCWEGKFKACSKCGSYVEWNETLGANFWKFCPYCGAKMDEEVRQ